ncbi:DUF3343 domain-containing protein [Lutispora thermophila]|uniref:Putative Se/S carrier protein-like domain-containing protein n=1 Tax=Lutispora thermophila DSM 19022 TaxID=1122184 RepID=A0A1M6E738_9FIRM|nr:DUF3343 domain-containing protein [Lutispora thermophila]SHI81098.1 Protein of unknown function [Lutispora thermophila DSM 19022]
MEYDYYILFNTHTDGLNMAKRLKESNIKYTITPTPRQLSKCCGIAIKYEHEDEKAILDIIDKYDIKVLGLHSLERKNVDIKFI